MATTGPNETGIGDYNYNAFNYFFRSLILSCCFVMFLPPVSANPNNLLFCYFFIALSVIALFLTWYYKNSDPARQSNIFWYILPAVFFIVASLFASFSVILTKREIIQLGNVNDFYYKFNTITSVLILVECYLYNTLNNVLDLSPVNPKVFIMYDICIFTFCLINIFVIVTNSIGLSSFSADG
jgi:hypothetical protein